jgi:hypothetical protein
MLRPRVAVLGVVVLGANLAACTQSLPSASSKADASRSDAGSPHDAAGSPDLMPADAAVNCANTEFVSSYPSSFCAVRCKSGSPASDVVVQVDQTSVPHGGEDNGFVVRIVQTVPALCDQTFTDVHTLWSGDFMNFSGQNSQWQFHLLPSQSASSAYGGIDNVEVDPLGGSFGSGPVYVDSTNGGLLCQIFTN